ncbi:MAG: Protein-glutamate O-methyltransferase, partial [Oerskovia sp.]|nr:Protein-glutamate O-methyltransferase [Oerskovia sp.]
MSTEDRAPVGARTADESSDPTTCCSTGRWRYELATGQWWWSEETFRLHGFEPHEVVPTTALVL